MVNINHCLQHKLHIYITYMNHHHYVMHNIMNQDNIHNSIYSIYIILLNKIHLNIDYILYHLYINIQHNLVDIINMFNNIENIIKYMKYKYYYYIINNLLLYIFNIFIIHLNNIQMNIFNNYLMINIHHNLINNLHIYYYLNTFSINILYMSKYLNMNILNNFIYFNNYNIIKKIISILVHILHINH